MRINRRKTKITYIDPGAGHWGMHDGYGNYPEKDFYRVAGILFCKKHFTIPDKHWESFSQVYEFNCRKCEIEQFYVRRRDRILAERKKGRKRRVEDYKKECADRAARCQALKSIYSGYNGMAYRENPLLALIKKKEDE